MRILMPRLGTPEVSSSHQTQPRLGQFQPTSSSLQFEQFQPTSFSARVPVSSSSLPHPVLQFQPTSSSAVYLTQCSSSSLYTSLSAPVPAYTSSSTPVPVCLIHAPVPAYLIQCSPHPCSQSPVPAHIIIPAYLILVLQFQPTSSSAPIPQSTSYNAPVSAYLIQCSSSTYSSAEDSRQNSWITASAKFSRNTTMI